MTRRNVTIYLSTLVVALALAWWAGVDAGHALAFAGAGVVVVFLWRTAPGQDATAWPRPGRRPQHGARDDVARLAWSLGTNRDRSGVDAVGLRRVRTLARARLALHGLDLGDSEQRDRIEALIGAPAYDVVRPSRAIRPSLRELEVCVLALQRVGTGAPAVPSPEPTGGPHDR
jgi:hypothetical protein